jgi:hypothetical protein
VNPVEKNLHLGQGKNEHGQWEFNSVPCPVLCLHFITLLRQEKDNERRQGKRKRETVNRRRVTVIAGGSVGRHATRAGKLLGRRGGGNLC